MNHNESFWWEPIELAVGEGRRWRLGDLEIDVHRSGSEWHTAHGDLPKEDAGTAGSAVRPIDEIGEKGANMERFASDPNANQVRLLPRVAERSVVATPRIPIHVLPNHQAKFYVSSPVWVEISVGEPWVALRSVPTRQLSDTWFGPSTREGEVAFSIKTQARARLAEIPRQVQRAITPVVVRNRSDELLSVSRLNLPVPYLSIFHTPAGHLWTQQVLLEHHDDSGLARLDIDPGAPAEATDASRLSGARSTAEEHLLVRAFSTILRTLDLDD